MSVQYKAIAKEKSGVTERGEKRYYKQVVRDRLVDLGDFIEEAAL